MLREKTVVLISISVYCLVNRDPEAPANLPIKRKIGKCADRSAKVRVEWRPLFLKEGFLPGVWSVPVRLPKLNIFIQHSLFMWKKIDGFTNFPHLFLTPEAKNDQTLVIFGLSRLSNRSGIGSCRVLV